MVDISAVKPQEPDPKTGKPKPKSGIAFPYYNLDKCIEVARIVMDKGGGRCERAALAPWLGYSQIRNGGFLTRMSASKMFGLIDQNGEFVTVTERGKTILSPVRPSDADKAKFDAFMDVALFDKVFKAFDGQALPAEMGMRNYLLNECKVVPNQVQPTLRVLLDSADSAGLFKVSGNRSRMVKPPLVTADAGRGGENPPDTRVTREEVPTRTLDPLTTPKLGGGGGTGGGTGDGPKFHPALAGLIQSLPPIGERLGPKRREAVVEAFKHAINFIYPEDEEQAK